MNKLNLNNSTKIIYNCKDYTVSQENYNLHYNKEYDMLVTQPIPNNLENYYKSENYISHTDNNKTLIDKIYKKVRQHTLQKKIKLINSYKKSKTKSILDIGSGTGDFLKICKDNNWTISGVEPSEKARQIAKTKDIHLSEKIEKINKQFDIITMWHVLEHIPNLEDQINKIKKLLKPNGILIIAVPNYKSYDAKFYKEYWAAFDVPRHIWHFSKISISKIFNEINMKIEKIIPMKFDSYYVSLLSEKNKNKNFNPIKAFTIGLLSNLSANRTKEYSSHIYILKSSKKPF